MKSLGNELIYEIINSEEKEFLAAELEMLIFPNCADYTVFNSDYKNDKPYYFVKFKDEIIGITGINESDIIGEETTAWLGVIGIINKYRGKGLGKKILLDIFNDARKRGYETLRILLLKNKYKEAFEFFSKNMDIIENYTKENFNDEIVIFSKSLTKYKVEPFDDKNLFLKEKQKINNKILLNNIRQGEKIKNFLKDKNILN